MLVSSRFFVLIAVVASLLSSIGTFYMASVDVFQVLRELAGYASPGISQEVREVLRADTITNVVKAVDGYLLATVMLIFALGLYELFIGRIPLLENQPVAPKVLVITSLDDLKDRLWRVVTLILVVKFLQVSLESKYKTPQEALYLAVGIFLVAGALWLTGHHGGKKDA